MLERHKKNDRGDYMAGHGKVSSVLDCLQGALEIARLFRASGYVLDKSEMKRLLAELVGSISEAKMELSILQGNVEDKDAELIRLNEVLTYRGNMRRRGDAYYRTLDSKPYGQPYCSYCWEKDSQQYHLHNRILSKEVRVCPHCKNEFQAARTPYFEADKLAV
jgi:hypothetical protein|tara:strand:+ start:1971 stop:2459 length:489 start_codon:yes stop_codon:yes gene_type:complete